MSSLDEDIKKLYAAFLEEKEEREKTRRWIYIKNPEHYKVKARKKALFYTYEENNCICGEDVYGHPFSIEKDRLYIPYAATDKENRTKYRHLAT